MTAAVLLLAVLASDPPRPARELFANCRRTYDHGGAVFSCNGVVVHASDENLPLAKVVADMRAGWERKADFKNVVTTHPFPMEGRSLDAQHVVASVNGQIISNGEWVIFSDAPKRTRILGCSSPDADAVARRCPGLLQSLVVVDEIFLSEKPPILFDGKQKVLPAGCEILGMSTKGYQISCNKVRSAFTYAEAENEAQATQILEKTLDYMADTVPGAKKAPNEPCKVGGVARSCRVVRHEDFVMRGATFTTAERTVVVTCTQVPLQKGYHPVCSDVFGR